MSSAFYKGSLSVFKVRLRGGDVGLSGVPNQSQYSSRGFCHVGREILFLEYQQMETTQIRKGWGASPKRKYLYYQKDVKKVPQKRKGFEFFTP